MKGYKAFDEFLRCGMFLPGPGMQYEIGETYKYITAYCPIELCKRGYHFCSTLWCVYKWYPEHFATRVCEVEASGNIINSPDGLKSVTDTIRVVRELPPEEILKTMCNDYDDATTSYEHQRRMVWALSNIITTVHLECTIRVNIALREKHVLSVCDKPKALKPPSNRTLERLNKWLDALIRHTDHDLVLRARLLTSTTEQKLKEVQS